MHHSTVEITLWGWVHIATVNLLAKVGCEVTLGLRAIGLEPAGVTLKKIITLLLLMCIISKNLQSICVKQYVG